MIEEDISTIGSHAPSLGMQKFEVSLDTTENDDDVIVVDDEAVDDDTKPPVGSKAPTSTLNAQESQDPSTDLDLYSILLGAATLDRTKSPLASMVAPQSGDQSKVPSSLYQNINYADTAGLLEAFLHQEKISGDKTTSLSESSELLNGSQQLQINNTSSLCSFSSTLCTKKSSSIGFLDGDNSDVLSASNPNFDIRDDRVSLLFENDGDIMEARYITEDISTVGSCAPTLATRTSVRSGLSDDLLERCDKGNCEDNETDAGVLSSVGSSAPTLSTKKSILSSHATTGFSDNPAAEYVTGDLSTVGSSAPTIGTRATNKTDSTTHENNRKYNLLAKMTAGMT